MNTPAITTKSLATQLRLLIRANLPVFIHGSPGIGKSQIVHMLASEESLPINDVRLSQLDAVDLRGVPAVRNDRTCWMPPTFLPTSGEGILFLDELNAAPPPVQAAIYQLILDRKLGEYHLPQGWRIVCAGNRLGDRGIVFRLPSPLSNRMIHLMVEANFEDFKAWALQAGIHPYIIGFLGFRPDLLSSEPVADGEDNPAFATPRSWSMLSSILRQSEQIGTIRPLIYGAVGYGSGAEFLAFVDLYGQLPSIEAMLLGELATLPDTPGALYALVSAMVERFDGSAKQSKALIDQSAYFPVEFGVMLIKDALLKHESLSSAEGFDTWLEAHESYIL